MNTEELKDFTKKAPLEDYLDEDPTVYGQNFFILSYLLPNSKNELDAPIIKMRGAFKTVEDCQTRINKLKNIDTYFNMYICEVGKFGSLYSDSELSKKDDIDVEYRNNHLNDMVKTYKENKDKVDSEFDARQLRLSKQAKFEGTKEGQKLLYSQKENPVAVKTRVENLSLHHEDLKKQLDKVSEILEQSKKQLENDYTEEELAAADENILNNGSEKEPHENMFSEDDLFLSRKGKERM